MKVEGRQRVALAGGEAADCSIVAALEVVGDFWTLGILRSILYGHRRFAEIERDLGVATNVLSERLRRLVEAGVLERRRYQRRPDRYEYALTARGAELAPLLLGLKAWGDRHLREGGPASVVRHRGCASEVEAGIRCPDCGAEVGPGELEVEPRAQP